MGSRRTSSRSRARAARPTTEGNGREHALEQRLYWRANGFMLGCFLTLIRFRFARQLFRYHRARILEFLVEAGVDSALPERPDDYDARADEVLQQVVSACATVSRELAESVLAGGGACIDAAMRIHGTVESNELRDTVVDILDRCDLDGAGAYERFLARVAHQAETSEAKHKIDTFLSPAMGLLAEIVEVLPLDADVCFIAMPFRRPYAGYYATFYRPLAQELECKAFRMWGGLSGEEYVELMLAIMRRCRIVIADLSSLNANVVYEFGVARGLRKQVVPLVQRTSRPYPPSNVASDQLMLAYSPRETGWPKLTVHRCAAQVAIIRLASEMQAKTLASADRRAGAALPTLIAHT